MADEPFYVDTINKFLKDKLSADDFAHVSGLLVQGVEMEARARMATDNMARADTINRASGDMARDVVRRLQELETARSETSRILGNASLAHDSARGCYGAALRAMGKSTRDIAPEAMKDVFRAHSRIGTGIAMDAASVADFDERHPEVARIK